MRVSAVADQDCKIKSPKPAQRMNRLRTDVLPERSRWLFSLRLIHSLGETSLVAGGGITMNDALLHRLVDHRDRLGVSSLDIGPLRMREYLPQLSDLGTQPGTVGCVDGILLLILTFALLS